MKTAKAPADATAERRMLRRLVLDVDVAHPSPLQTAPMGTAEATAQRRPRGRLALAGREVG
jgi:hypothetical protein